MASFNEYRPGKFRIRYYLNRRAYTLYIPKRINRKTADSICRNIEQLVAMRATGEELPRRLVEWLARCSDEFHKALSDKRLVDPRRPVKPTRLSEYVDAYIESSTVAESTKKTMRTSKASLVEFFGEDCPIADVTPGDADRWREFLIKKKYAKATISLRVDHARQFFRRAFRDRLIPETPFLEVKAGSKKNKDTNVYVPRDVVEDVIKSCPRRDIQLCIRLSRFAGLRCPSEIRTLLWDDILWDESKIRVRSSKTGTRFIPLFPELQPLLSQHFHEAPEGATHVITAVKITDCIRDAVNKSGALMWPRVTHNMRGSCQTDLEDRFPTHVVCSWMGNSESIARDHYLKAHEEHFAMATVLRDVEERATQRATKNAGK